MESILRIRPRSAPGYLAGSAELVRVLELCHSDWKSPYVDRREQYWDDQGRYGF